VGNDGPTHYIVMEFIEGQDLKKIIKAEGALSVERALSLAVQICAGIGFAHRAGLVHADVKPQNILVTRDDIVKVTDFGIAQALSDAQPGEKQSVVWGSPHYFAPEQARGEKPSPASDVYSIGILMFEMLTGRLPYSGANQQELALAHIRDRVPMVSEFNPTVPDPVAQIVYKIMSKEPAARYRMADQLGHILGSYRDRRDAPNISMPPQAPVQAQSAPWQPVSPPAPPPQQPPLPQGVEPLPTQRYDLAPNAPQPVPYNRPPGYQEAPAQQPYQSQPYYPQQMSGNTGAYYSQPLQDRSQRETPPTLDLVTIALAVLAFFAVACLIPLYIAVFQARFGG
jgi:eukaryotic-like serine/threonine-protein kinase